MKKNIQKGFTMIELVIVIAILGILAAFALPRFANFVPAAQTSTRAGIVSSINSAIGIAHAQWVANGQTGTVILDGDSSANAITMNAQGYPDVGVTYNSPSTCQQLVSSLLSTVSSDITVGFTTPNCTLTSTNFGSGGTITLTPTNAS